MYEISSKTGSGINILYLLEQQKILRPSIGRLASLTNMAALWDCLKRLARFLPMLSAVFAVIVCLCLSHSGRPIVSKRLNVGSRK